MAEVVKYGYIANKGILDLVALPDYKARIGDIIYECVKIKRDVVAIDEHDTGPVSYTHLRNGTKQIAVTHSIPNTPIEFLSSDAPDSTVSVASEITPPTTGTAPDTANFAVFSAILSTLPETLPAMVRYAVNSVKMSLRCV